MDVCTCPHFYQVILAVCLAAHSVTLSIDYWLGKAEHIASNSLVELMLKVFINRFKKPIEKEEQNGK